MLGEESTVEMHGSQRTADEHRAQNGHVGNGLEHAPSLAGRPAGLAGEVLGGVAHVA
jgi:hypothetical protein